MQNSPTDRARFTLAHELAHLIMHRIPTPDSEGEADRFASEFLMPARDIAADLNGFSLQKAAVLKPYWRVSMAALIQHAEDLSKITEWQHKNLNIQKNKLNGRGLRSRSNYRQSTDRPAGPHPCLS